MFHSHCTILFVDPVNSSSCALEIIPLIQGSVQMHVALTDIKNQQEDIILLKTRSKSEVTSI